VINGNGRTVADLVTEIREELKEFVATRVSMLRSEMSEKLTTVKRALPVMGVGIVLLLTAWLAFNGFLVCGIAIAFAGYGPWAWVISFLIVAFAYCLIGAIALMGAINRLKEKSMKPERTMRVLQQDRLWLQTEAKTQL